ALVFFILILIFYFLLKIKRVQTGIRLEELNAVPDNLRVTNPSAAASSQFYEDADDIVPEFEPAPRELKPINKPFHKPFVVDGDDSDADEHQMLLNV
ncbi:hypothetical protein HK098_004574, partial [Nowakowskiella sp. JEL0407]